ncbi:hypothetical protein TNCT_623441 [Trichonephila clavata]|uniref:Uncharacterized protein n=1 Tax=Trichonephila clavata TaxID=2740835 RepID=A0A8X6GC84_TRICU|nr:hypothetical protein TNCT_623441 [Trichonephila clavata]
MSTLIRKKYLSSADKRKKIINKSHKPAEQMNKTYNLFQLDFTCRTSTEKLLDSSPNTSTGEIIAVDSTPQEIVEEEDGVQMHDDIQADSNAQLDIQNRNHLGPEYQNNIGLWRNIIEDVLNFWG